MKFLTLVALAAGMGVSAHANETVDNTFKIALEREVEVQSVEAQVTIVDGVAQANNCADLTEARNDRVRYDLKIVDGKFLCVPNQTKIRVSEIVDVVTDHEIGFFNLKQMIDEQEKAYETENGFTDTFHTKQMEAPSCSMTAEGELDLSSCRCSDAANAFNTETRQCQRHPYVVKYRYNTCGGGGVNAAGKLVGVDVYPDTSGGITFAMCMDARGIKYLIPHKLPMKIFFSKAMGKELAEAAGVNFETEKNLKAVKLVVTEDDIKEYVAWYKEWTNTVGARIAPQALVDYAGRSFLLELRSSQLVEMNVGEFEDPRIFRDGLE